MASILDQIGDMFILNHFKDPYPNIILFAIIGFICSQKLAYDEFEIRSQIYRKLDIKYNESPLSFVFERIFIAYVGIAAGAMCGYISGSVLMSFILIPLLGVDYVLLYVF